MNVLMPQLGETVTEGTVAHWHKKVGDAVIADEIILDIETDKVSMEIPAPGNGVITEIRVQEGTTVEVGTVLAVIASSASETQSAQAPPAQAAAAQPAAAQGAAEAPIAAAAVDVPAGATVPAQLAAILAAHPLIHTAEGEMYRDALRLACERASLPVVGFRERDLCRDGRRAAGDGAGRAGCARRGARQAAPRS